MTAMTQNLVRWLPARGIEARTLHERGEDSADGADSLT
jgi:hypothetical protein